MRSKKDSAGDARYHWVVLRRWAWIAPVLALLSCRKEAPRKKAPTHVTRPAPPPRPPMPWDKGDKLAEGETYALRPAPGKSERQPITAAQASGLLDVDLGDNWAPYIFSDGAPEDEKPNFYRPIFVALANNRTTPDELFFESPEGRQAILSAANVPPRKKNDPVSPEEKKALDAAKRLMRGERSRNFLEVFGIPPSLSVLRGRLEEDRARTCYQDVDLAALAALKDTVIYSNREHARKQFTEAQADAAWAEKVLAPHPDGGTATVALPTSVLPTRPTTPEPSLDDPKVQARLERFRRGALRLAAVRAAQERLVCEGILSPKSKYTEGMFDLATHEALALWERKNDIFGWGFLGEETLQALQKPPLAMHYETFKRILIERVAEAAGIIEDGSATKGKKPTTYKVNGAPQPVPDLIGQHVEALLAALKVATPDDMVALLLGIKADKLPNFRVAFAPPPLPPYYGPEMDLTAEIDRGDVWYDFPWDAKGKPIVQKRVNYPRFTIFVNWENQKIPLARWRTTIGSWRSELHSDGKVYYKYKNSDVGPRIWKNVVAAPVWIPPEGTPAKDLLTKKVFDRNMGPVEVVNTDVMGPGFQSAYGLVMAIHLKEMPGGGVFDNQIRTHGSVDYTSIARRFSHGCHRLVNNRAVRLFDFVLRHRKFVRQGNMSLGHMKKVFTVEDKEYEYELNTRGYYYELKPPVKVEVTEGKLMGEVKKPIVDFVRKPGVDYGDGEDVETAPVVGP
jgi:hypothetical protein